jgi:hypothetical protein
MAGHVQIRTVGYRIDHIQIRTVGYRIDHVQIRTVGQPIRKRCPIGVRDESNTRRSLTRLRTERKWVLHYVTFYIHD